MPPIQGGILQLEEGGAKRPPRVVSLTLSLSLSLSLSLPLSLSLSLSLSLFYFTPDYRYRLLHPSKKSPLN